MNYLSDGNKKSILGKRLSSRYLSSDAFTSSAGKTSGRSISQLGSLFGRKSGNRKFSGAGQRIGLFEFKNIFLKIVFIITCLIVIGYTIPATRYAMHRFFTRQTISFGSVNEDSSVQTVHEGEYYVAPSFGQTDRFSVDISENSLNTQGQSVYTSQTKKILIGTLEFSTSSKPHVILLSEVGQKNNLFVKNAQPVPLHDVSVATGTSVGSSTEETLETDTTTEFTSALFEGFGYGQLRAQVPPQQRLEVGTLLYARTTHGLAQAARVSFVEKDTGSTFTNIHAQLLVPPFYIYKVYIEDAI